MFCKPQRLVLSCIWIVSLAALLAACAPAAAPTPTSVPKPAPAAAPTTAPPKPAPTAVAPKPAPTVAPKAGPAGPPTTAPVAKPAGPSEWVVAIAEEAPTLDPSWVAALAGNVAQHHIFDMLTDVVPEGTGFKVAPMLAESWNRVDDQTWVLKIRKGIKFHNGDDFTANDVKYSLDIYKSEKSQRRSYGARLKDVEQIDQYTVRVTTDGPNPAFLNNLSYLFIMPQAREKMGEDAFGRSAIGTGPYKVVEFVRGQRLVLEANPIYWRGQVNPKKLTLRPIRDPSTQVAELKAGGVQIISAVPPARLQEVQSGDTELVTIKGGRLIVYPFNTKDKPFDDVRVRQAVNYAIDRDAIIKNVLEGHAVPLQGPFSAGWLGYDPDLKPYPYDPAKARQLLADAGYPNGLETTWSTTQGVFLKDREIAEVVANQTARVNVKVQIVPTERAKLQSDWTNGVFQGITSMQFGRSADAESMLVWFFDQKKAHKPDEKLNSLMAQSRRTIDPDQRKKVLQDLGRYVHDQAYWMFVHAEDQFFAKRKDVPWTPLSGSGGSFSNIRYHRAPGASASGQ